MRFLARFIGFVLVAAGFVGVVLDGARSIANGVLLVTPLAETLLALLGERFVSMQAALQRDLPAFLWDPVVVTLLRTPTTVLALVLGFLLTWLGRRPPEPIGILTRR